MARVVPRTVLSAENLLWTTLFGLLLRDLVWLPVAGMLPRRHLSGPLDLGTPAFAQHRAEPLAERLAALQAGEGTRLLDEAWAHRGERLRGVAWDAWSREDLVRCLEGVGGPALAEILGRLAAEGWAAAVGLPDLVVLPGPATRLPESYPSRLDEGLVLVEVKGPTDTVRDAQAVWFDRLLAAGAPVAVWRVAPLPGG